MTTTDRSERVEASCAALYDLETLASEIAEFTCESYEVVWQRIASELAQSGHNVTREAKRFNVTPHIFNDNMLTFYRESDGFIYETLVESRNPFRVKKWLNIVDFILTNSALDPPDTTVLLYGDSVGSDSIFLKQLGYDVYYHDFESYCSEFAKQRFSKRGITVKMLSNSNVKQFDHVICLEVAEHVPQVRTLIQEIAFLTKDTGFCIFSEAFGLLTEVFPTHLRENLKYGGKAPELFKSAGMHLYWKDRHNKPFVFTKHRVFPNLPLLKIIWGVRIVNLLRRITNKIDRRIA